MGRPIVAVVVLVPVAALVAVWAWRVAATAPVTWRRQEVRHATAGAILVVPGAVAYGAVNGWGTGVTGLLLWGLLAGVFLGAARIDAGELDADSDTRWLLDVSCLAFVAVTVFFSVVGFAYVFIPSAAFLVVGLRFARMRRQRSARRRTAGA